MGQLADLLAAVDLFLLRRSVPTPVASRTRLVVEELVINAFRHGGAANAGGVALELRADGASPEGSVSHAGPAFDPTVPPPRADADECPIGGQGLTLVHSLTRRLDYTREGDINRVEFEIFAGEIT